jgi:hypothetical protein
MVHCTYLVHRKRQPQEIGAMMRSFEEFQTFGKDGFEAYVAASNALTKGVQAMAQEASEFSRKSFEKGAAALEKAVAVKSFDKVLEVQQAFAKESYETLVAQMTKFNELYVSTAKETFKPFEASFAAFGVKAPK